MPAYNPWETAYSPVQAGGGGIDPSTGRYNSDPRFGLQGTQAGGRAQQPKGYYPVNSNAPPTAVRDKGNWPGSNPNPSGPNQPAGLTGGQQTGVNAIGDSVLGPGGIPAGVTWDQYHQVYGVPTPYAEAFASGGKTADWLIGGGAGTWGAANGITGYNPGSYQEAGLAPSMTATETNAVTAGQSLLDQALAGNNQWTNPGAFNSAMGGMAAGPANTGAGYLDNMAGTANNPVYGAVQNNAMSGPNPLLTSAADMASASSLDDLLGAYQTNAWDTYTKAANVGRAQQGTAGLVPGIGEALNQDQQNAGRFANTLAQSTAQMTADERNRRAGMLTNIGATQSGLTNDNLGLGLSGANQQGNVWGNVFSGQQQLNAAEAERQRNLANTSLAGAGFGQAQYGHNMDLANSLAGLGGLSNQYMANAGNIAQKDFSNMYTPLQIGAGMIGTAAGTVPQPVQQQDSGGWWQAIPGIASLFG